MEQKDKELRDKKVLKIFIIIAIGISFLLEVAYIIFHAITGKTNGFFTVAVMWVPAITAIVLTLKYYKRISILGVTIGKATPILLGLFLPFIYLTLSYLISWAVFKDNTIGFEALALNLGWEEGKGDIPFLFVLSHVAVGLIPGCIGVFGQELGWRGFLYPILERVEGRKKAVIINGLLSAVWLLPLVISGLYETYTVRWYGVIMFVLYTVALGIVLAWLRSVSKSIVPCLLFTATANLLDDIVFQKLGTNPRVFYLGGETGIITIILLLLTALVGWFLWKKHDKKLLEA